MDLNLRIEFGFEGPGEKWGMTSVVSLLHTFRLFRMVMVRLEQS